MLTRGTINQVVAGSGGKPGKLILIGGLSAHHAWGGDTVIERIAQATDRGRWLLGDLWRTPEQFLDKTCRHLQGVTVLSHLETPPDWVPEQLHQAKDVWATEDRVPMIYEALTSGARGGLLPVPQIKAGFRAGRRAGGGRPLTYPQHRRELK